MNLPPLSPVTVHANATGLSIPDALLAVDSLASTAPPFLTGARLLTAAGLAVFPLSPGRKPLVKCGTAATTDPVVLANWAARWPAASIGIACKPSMLLVVDLDVKHPPVNGRKSWAALTAASGDPEAAPAHLYDRTTLIKTRSGGDHLWFRDEPGTRHGRDDLLPGIDVKASQGDCGGFVVAPPTPGYEVLGLRPPMPVPGWLARILAHDDKPAKAPAPGTSSFVRPGSFTQPTGSGYAAAAFRGEVANVLAAQVGTRNDALHRAAFSLGTLVASGDLATEIVTSALTESARQAGLGSAETASTINSGLRAGMQHPRRAA